MIVDAQLQPQPSSMLNKNVSLPANLVNLDQNASTNNNNEKIIISDISKPNMTTPPTTTTTATALPAPSLKSSTTTTSMRKQIQFNLDEKKKVSEGLGGGTEAAKLQEKTPGGSLSSSKINWSMIGNSKNTTSSLHETLKQLKADEMRKRRSRGSLGDEKRKRKSTSQWDLKAFNEKLDEIKRNMYHFLERPVGAFGFIHRIFTLTIILGSILIGASATLKTYERQSILLMHHYEIFVTVYFGIEYMLRVWSSGTCAKYKGVLGRVRFIFTPLLIIEAVLIGVNIVILAFFPDALSVMRFFQLIRFLYIDRQAQTWIILMKVIHQHRFELLSSFYIGIIILLFSSYFIMLVEKPYSDENNDNHFHSYADAMYWSIITMTTIGYGDRSPRTFLGKIVATSLCIAGVAFWTLPGGIIGSGFALKVEQKNRQKQFNRLVPAAVQLIQAWWRMKATIFISSSNVSCLVATVSTFDVSKPIYSSSLRRLKRRLDSSSNSNYDELTALFGGLDAPTVRLDPSPASAPKRPGFGLGSDEEEEDGLRGMAASSSTTSPNQESGQGDEQRNHHESLSPSTPPSSQQQPLIQRQMSARPEGSSHSSNATTHDDSVLMQLSPEHLMLIRTILLIKFFVARRKFKLAFKPYDFKDVIENYTQGNMDMATKMKELQRKFDQLMAGLNPPAGMYYSHYGGASGGFVPGGYPLVGAGGGGGGVPSSGGSLNGGSHYRSRSPPSSVHSSYQESINRPPPPPMPPNPFMPSSSSSSSRFRAAVNRLSSPPAVISEEVVTSHDNVINRINHIENEMSTLNAKLDQLIRITTATATATNQRTSHASD